MVVGMGCTKSTWPPDLLRTLAETREVVIFDNRGSGRSTDPDWSEHGSMEGYANSTIDLVHALDLEQPDILGWSMVSVSDRSEKQVYPYWLVSYLNSSQQCDFFLLSLQLVLAPSVQKMSGWSDVSRTRLAIHPVLSNSLSSEMPKHRPDAVEYCSQCRLVIMHNTCSISP